MKSSLHILTFILACFCSIQTLKASSSWKDVTLYTFSGDSVQGEISMKATIKSYYSISVRDKVSHTIKQYNPFEIKSFVVKTPEQTLYFRSLKVEADFSPTELTELGVSPLVTLLQDRVFAQLLTGGEKELYFFKDNHVFKVHYLIRTSDEEAMDLINKRYYINSTRTISAYNEEYKKQLNKILTGSSSINSNRINKTGFTKGELKALIKDYNSSLNSANLYELKEEKIIAKFGIVGGFNQTTFRFSGADPMLNQIEFNKSSGVNAGLKLELILPRTQKKLSLYNEALFSNYSFRSNEFYYYYNGEQNYEKQRYEFKASYLKIATALRFRFPMKPAPFIQAGVVNGFALKHTATVTKQHVLFASNSISTEPTMFRAYEQSVFAGVGCAYKGIGIELRYEMGNGMSGHQQIGTVMRYSYVLLNYTF